MKLTIDKQVCTLQQGKRLEELGVTNEALFYHCVFCPDPLGETWYYEVCYSTGEDTGFPGERVAPAFSVSELLNIYGIGTKATELLWQRLLDGINANTGLTNMITATFLADFYIHLLENKLITI